MHKKIIPFILLTSCLCIYTQIEKKISDINNKITKLRINILAKDRNKKINELEKERNNKKKELLEQYKDAIDKKNMAGLITDFDELNKAFKKYASKNFPFTSPEAKFNARYIEEKIKEIIALADKKSKNQAKKFRISKLESTIEFLFSEFYKLKKIYTTRSATEIAAVIFSLGLAVGDYSSAALVLENKLLFLEKQLNNYIQEYKIRKSPYKKMNLQTKVNLIKKLNEQIKNIQTSWNLIRYESFTDKLLSVTNKEKILDLLKKHQDFLHTKIGKLSTK